MLPLFLRVGILLIIATLYAVFDVFNKRNVPNAFVYVTTLIAVIVTLTYDVSTIEMSALFAIAIGALGYVVYRTGFLGAGDVFEFAAISMIFPFQPNPILINSIQSTIPFIVSVFIVTGYVSALLIVVYYLLISKKTQLEKNFRLGSQKVVMAGVLLAAYAALGVLLKMTIGVTPYAAVLLLIIAIPSAIVVMYEKLINMRMVSLEYIKTLEEGDMIAVNLMDKKDVQYFKKQSKSFGRLVTRKLISDTRNVRKKVPVYRNSAPLALFVLIGIVVALLFGNVIFLLV
jgi:Flp pilus assembly protein protease CpaA